MDRTRRIIVVTGAASGIGRAACLRFAQERHEGLPRDVPTNTIVACDLNLTGAQRTLVMCGVTDPKDGMALSVDVGDGASVEAMVLAVLAQFGRIDVAFLNAGIEGERSSIVECTEENFDRVMRTNAKGVFLCLKHVLKSMAEVGSGVVVNTASTAGLSAMPEFSPYCASKHAIVGMTKCAAKEYASKGIRVVAICPSTTDTPMVDRFTAQWPKWQAEQNACFPMGRIGTAEEVANLVAFLASDACPFITGTCLTIDGGRGA